MEILHKFRTVVRENDFVEVGDCQDGTTSWFSKASANMRLCVDGVTNSATVFWGCGPGQLASKTSGSYSDGSSQDLTSTAIWSSSAGAIASVSTSGLVSGLKPGSATITATFNGVSGSTIITAANRTLQSIVVTPVNASITSGQKQQFQATANYADGTMQDVSASAHWSTSSASIATINSGQNGGGLATAKASGTVTITATLNLVSGSTTATVN
jgi:uncharacterized protein YjdB